MPHLVTHQQMHLGFNSWVFQPFLISTLSAQSSRNNADGTDE